MEKASSMRSNGGTGPKHRNLSAGRMNRRLGERTSQLPQQQPARLAGPAVLSSSTLGQFMPNVPYSSSATQQVKSAGRSLTKHSPTGRELPLPFSLPESSVLILLQW